jgi:hypothetical protein
MRDPQPNSWLAGRAGAGWPARPGSGHPFVAGALCLALAVSAWHGLLWGIKRTAEVGAPAPGSVATAKDADTPRMPDTRRVVLGPRPSPAPPLPGAPGAPRSSPGPRTSPPPPLPRVSATPLSPPKPPVPKTVSDSAAKSELSPFRRTHPWAAPAGGRYYYPSGCPATLRLPDVIFFRSEAEARASGFISSRLPQCE